MKNRLLQYMQPEPDCVAPVKPKAKQAKYKPKRSGKDRWLVCRFINYYPGTKTRNGSGHTLTTDGNGNYRVLGENAGPAAALRAYIIWSTCPDRELEYLDRVMLRELANEARRQEVAYRGEESEVE